VDGGVAGVTETHAVAVLGEALTAVDSEKVLEEEGEVGEEVVMEEAAVDPAGEEEGAVAMIVIMITTIITTMIVIPGEGNSSSSSTHSTHWLRKAFRDHRPLHWTREYRDLELVLVFSLGAVRSILQAASRGGIQVVECFHRPSVGEGDQPRSGFKGVFVGSLL